MALDFSTYPPKGHQERIAAYQRYEKLFLGQHKDLYQAMPGRYQMVRYIVANFAGLISRLVPRRGDGVTCLHLCAATMDNRPGMRHTYVT